MGQVVDTTFTLPNHAISSDIDSIPPPTTHKELGHASYYSQKFEGRKTANGEIFRNDSLTAAHRTLPFGTIVRVCSTTDTACVVVRINDRGPYSKKFTIDLSKAAAQQIGLTRTLGHIPVWVEVLEQTAKED